MTGPSRPRARAGGASGDGPPGEDEDPGRSPDPPTHGTHPAALLLAGGRSRRLGTDKPFVEIGGRTLLERALDATASIDDVVISVRDPAPFEAALRARGWRRPGAGQPSGGVARAGAPEGPDATGRALEPPLARGARRVRLLPDREPDPGPLAALAGGLAAVRGDPVIVLSADLPFVSPALVARLLTTLAGAPEAEGCVPLVGGRPQWLCAAYRGRLARPALAWVARERDPSVRGFMESRNLRYLDEVEFAGCGDPATLTRDIDTPADLSWARAQVGEEGGEGPHGGEEGG